MTGAVVLASVERNTLHRLDNIPSSGGMGAGVTGGCVLLSSPLVDVYVGTFDVPWVSGETMGLADDTGPGASVALTGMRTCLPLCMTTVVLLRRTGVLAMLNCDSTMGAERCGAVEDEVFAILGVLTKMGGGASEVSNLLNQVFGGTWAGV